MDEGLTIGGVQVRPGTAQTVQLPVAPLYTSIEMSMPVNVIRGRREGPRLFVSGAVHGDEINGTEIIRRLLERPEMSRLKGTLLAVPVVNIFGYAMRSRYLPDRRDLNRSFPGSRSGSMASRMAHLFMREIVSNATHGIDLHSGAVHRTNMPHVRVCFDQEKSVEMAHAFRVPLILHSDLRDGSLRQAALERRLPILVYEAGEALRFNEDAIRVGLRGVLAVMRSLGMLPRRNRPSRAIEPLISTDASWIRAPDSGTLVCLRGTGDVVEKGDVLGYITDPMGTERVDVHATVSGVIVGQALLPLVYEGEALFNIAALDRTRQAEEALETFDSNLENDPDLPPDPEADETQVSLG